VAVGLAIIGSAALLASAQLPGHPGDVQAAAAVDTLRSYPEYSHATIRSARLTSSTPARVVVCLDGGRGGVALSHGTGEWRLVAHPRGSIRRAVAACR
jgi:hypothetical protein